MTLSYCWLLEYLPKPLPLSQLTHILTSIGLEVEGTDEIGAAPDRLQNFVVGEVLTCVSHPNADRLKLTTVNTGTETPSAIVCGAPNVVVGARVIVALPGAVIRPKEGAPFAIKKSKIRGEASEGMLCSAAELGVSDDASGLLLLEEKFPAGTPAAEVFPSNSYSDTAIHIGLTPNRSDAASHLGTARDVCAYQSYHTGEKWTVQMPETAVLKVGKESPVTVDIESEACEKYYGLVLDNIQVAPSPEWLQNRLTTIGIRPINNVVDVTNYVLHEYGQPLHAFDAAPISGSRIIVRQAHEGEKFTTLEGTERTLQTGDLVIADAEKALCIAGVMGGQNSGVSETTKSIFLESALFHAASVRRSSLHHNLRTDAATHFEKGVDPEAVLPALQRAAFLLQQLAGATLNYFPEEKGTTQTNPKTITLTLSQVRQLAGKAYTTADVEGILTVLGFSLKSTGAEAWQVTIPAYKTDVHVVADLVEEILRIDGLDAIALPETMVLPRQQPRLSTRAEREKLARILQGMGLHEILTNSIVNSKWYAPDAPLVSMCNALSSELDVLRPGLLESGLEVIAWNLNRKVNSLPLFEFGTAYEATGTVGQYREKQELGIWLCGTAGEIHWQGGARKYDLYALKGIVENLFSAAGVEARAQHKNDQVEYFSGKERFAVIVPVAADRLQIFGIKEAVYFATIDWQRLMESAAQKWVRFTELPRLPLIERDLALVVDSAVAYEAVEKATRKASPALLKNFRLFDVFENEKLGAGKKSLAIRYHFQPEGQMPEDVQIDGWMKALTDTYSKELGATVRL